MAKIIEFPTEKVKYIVLHVTSPMLTGLVIAVNKERLNMPFDRTDLRSAFKPLYKNGFITVKSVKENGKNKNVWYVTNLGKKVLRLSGIKQVS